MQLKVLRKGGRRAQKGAPTWGWTVDVYVSPARVEYACVCLCASEFGPPLGVPPLLGKKLKVAPANGILQTPSASASATPFHSRAQFRSFQRQDPLPGAAFVSSTRERVESLLVFGIASHRIVFSPQPKGKWELASIYMQIFPDANKERGSPGARRVWPPH